MAEAGVEILDRRDRQRRRERAGDPDADAVAPEFAQRCRRVLVSVTPSQGPKPVS